MSLERKQNTQQGQPYPLPNVPPKVDPEASPQSTATEQETEQHETPTQQQVVAAS